MSGGLDMNDPELPKREREGASGPSGQRSKTWAEPVAPEGTLPRNLDKHVWSPDHVEHNLRRLGDRRRWRTPGNVDASTPKLHDALPTSQRQYETSKCILWS